MPVIEIKNVSKKFKYNNKDFYALKDVSFEVRKGEIFGLLGPNGAGKSTLMNIIGGILTPDIGTIRVFGKSINEDTLDKIGFVSGGSRFHYSMKTKDVLNFYSMLYEINNKDREKRLSKLVEFFDLKDLMDRKTGYLSTGEKMRLVFAKSLIHYPPLLLLDEPTLGLDPDIALKVRKEIERINRKFKTTIIITSHYMTEVEQLADRIAFISKGVIADIGKVEKIKSKHFSYFDISIKLKEIYKKEFLKSNGFEIKGNLISKKLRSEEDVSKTMSLLVKNGFEIIDIETKKPTLEDYFVKMTGGNK